MPTETPPNDDAIVTPPKAADADKGTVGTPPTKPDDSKTSEDGKTFSSDYVKDLRKESADYRQKAKDLQKKAEDAENKANELKASFDADKAEYKKALEETRKISSAMEQRTINAELKSAALQEGLVDMDAFRMVDTSKVKLDEKGEVTGIKELMAELKTNKPYLFKEVSTSNKNAGAPPADNSSGEKPVYKDAKEAAEAKRKYMSSLT